MDKKDIERYTGIKDLHKNDTMQKRNILTMVHLKDLWESNIVKNMPYIKHDINELWNDFKVIEGILVSAGPSLKKNLSNIRQMKTGRELYSVDMATKYLLDNGIKPDYVVCSEAKPESSKILNFKCNIPLICGVTTNPEIVKNWMGDMYFFVSNNPCIDLDNSNQMFSERHKKLSGINTMLTLGGNVGTATMSFMLSIRNCKKIYLYGHDFSWVNDFYCGGIQKELAQERIKTEKHFGTFCEKKDINGNTVFTNMSLLTFLDWYERVMKRYPDVIENRTGAGLLN